MSDYWQVIRRPPKGDYQSIGDYRNRETAVQARDDLNRDYQTDEYAVIHRTYAGLVSSIGSWRDGKTYPESAS